MKSRIVKTTVLSLAILFIAAIPSRAQESLEATLSTTAGELFPFTPGQLMVSNAWLNTVNVNGENVLAGLVGSATFTTPQFSSGSVATGGRFNAGGSFYISSIYDVDVTASFVHGTWERLALSNGTANYVMVAEIEGTMFYLGTTYNIQGRAIEIGPAMSGSFLGTHTASGGTTDVVRQ